MFRWVILLAVFALASAAKGDQVQLKFRDEFIPRLAQAVPGILKEQDPNTGRFGTGIWIVTDQNVMWPLAVAWATKSDKNPYYHDPKLLDAIMTAGDALAEDADDKGAWVFRKKDGSTWGDTYMPWTYTRWIRTFGLIRDAMPPDRRKRWEDALLLGYANISKTQLDHVHNIPCYNAMGLYAAGQLFNKPEWCAQAKEFMAKVVAAQDPGGFWSEHNGPVVGYNFVYIEGLGAYYAMSRDETVLEALRRAAKFHSAFIYPNGSSVETVDERMPYHYGIAVGNVGFTFTPEGRGYLAHQLGLLNARKKPLSPDFMASLILCGEEGPTAPIQAEQADQSWVSGDGKALIRRKGKWFVCLSAYCCPVYPNRWIQDRQNLVSIFNDKTGLIVGGGNTKLQPLWSNFTVGDTSLLHHKSGDTKPDFTPPEGLWHIPSAATIEKNDPVGLDLQYGPEKCGITVEPVNDSTLKLHLKATVTSDKPVAAHVTLIPHWEEPLRTEGGTKKTIDDEPFTLSGKELGSWIEHAGWRLTVPEGATVQWPVLPHNPYVKDGSAKPAEGRIVVTIPFSKERQEYALTLKVEP